MQKKLIIVTGPTGSGKTELSIKLAKKFNGEIISADSRQVYKGMRIGTAQPCVEAGSDLGSERRSRLNVGTTPQNADSVLSGVGEAQRFSASTFKGIPHYLIGFLEPDKIFSVAEFKNAAIEIAKDIISRGKIPIICGGTAHYIQSITEGLSIPPVPPNWKLRKRLEKKSLKFLIAQLKKLDPESLKIVDLKNKRRVIRALEVCQAGYKFSKIRKKSASSVFGKSARILQLAIDIPRHELYKRVDKRVEKMIKDGLVDETKKLIKYFRQISNLKFSKIPSTISDFKHLPALSGIGYKEIIDYLEGKTTLEEAIQLIKYRTHKYIRYQMGWFRKNKKIKWVKNYKEAEKEVRKFIYT